jgi:hypothetical protein
MMKISVKLVALHFQLSILTGKFKLQNQVSFLLLWRTFGLEILILLTVGSIPRSTDDTLHQFQQMFPEPVGTLGSPVP